VGPTSGATSRPGLELIRRTSETRPDGLPNAYALAYPLLLAPSGAKFGKSESGDSVWLHPDGTSPYAFYQHWLNTDDRDTSVYLRWFTLFEPARIEALEAAIASAPGKREAQRELAFDLTARVHGSAAAEQARADSEALFGPEPLRDPALLARLHAGTRGFSVSAAADAPAASADPRAVTADARAAPADPQAAAADVQPASADAQAAAVLADAGVFPSRGEARRLIQNGGLTINGEAITDPAALMPAPIAGEWWDVRIGKRRREIGRLIRG
jgi:tyrosyl-tRNA synthetase